MTGTEPSQPTMTQKDNHYRRLERMYASAPCNQELAPRLTVTEGSAELVMQVAAAMFHAGGAVHGSFYFKLLDDAAYFAANSVVDDVFVLTATLNTQLLRPITTGSMRATGRIVRGGSTLLFAESRIEDDEGRALATAQGVFARSKTALADVEGYR